MSSGNSSSIRSLPAFLYGLALLNSGIAVFLADATNLGLTATFSVAILFTGVGGLVGVAASVRSRANKG